MDVQPALFLLGAEVPAATATRLSWSPSQSFEGIASPSPVLVVNGATPGPTLCLTAAIHGDELNGIEIVRRILYQLNPEKLSGAVIGVPIVNLQGFRRASRYLTDRRDLNRYFPGNEQGSSASRIAYSIFHQVITHCDVLVDLHTGSFYRENLPQLRADLQDPDIVKLTHNFGSIVVVHSAGAAGTLRGAAVAAGIPAVTLEAGGPMRLEKSAVEHGVKSIQTLLNKMKMVKKIRLWSHPEPVYYGSTWVRADRGGILFSEVKLGENIKKSDVLGIVTDPITNVSQNIVSPYNGKVIGMAVNQVVMPGFAAYHIGIAAEDDGELINPQDVMAGKDEQALQAVEVVENKPITVMPVDADIEDMND
ncbi:MAG: succinylglutamate desuccinylase/aspartoacylase family protein [Pseudomonadales bacterium]|nr:succinylglutamate desuccinylase/aspartoacylase family protein [Pseudomonadales bacterium]